jgi:hypothetical protein
VAAAQSTCLCGAAIVRCTPEHSLLARDPGAPVPVAPVPGALAPQALARTELAPAREALVPALPGVALAPAMQALEPQLVLEAPTAHSKMSTRGQFTSHASANVCLKQSTHLQSISTGRVVQSACCDPRRLRGGRRKHTGCLHARHRVKNRACGCITQVHRCRSASWAGVYLEYRERLHDLVFRYWGRSCGPLTAWWLPVQGRSVLLRLQSRYGLSTRGP